MWSLYEEEKMLKPLVFSNGKTQEDVVKEVLDAIKQGHKIIFIKGMCGTGKSAIALNLAKEFNKTSIVVPIKSLQEQYTNDYGGKKYVLKNKRFDIKNYPELENLQELKKSKHLNEPEKLKIYSIVGRKNFKCRFIQENEIDIAQKFSREKNAKLFDIFEGTKKTFKKETDESCDNNFLPCKIEIKEKNLNRIKDFIRKNPSVKLSDFDSINEIKRMTVAPVCPYWSPILPEEFGSKRFKDSVKVEYLGVNNRKYNIHQRKLGCPYYEQYKAYADSDVIIFNSSKYLIETLLGRKPSTDLEIIDECDEFLDSFANQEKINLNRLLFSLNFLFPEEKDTKAIIEKLIDITNSIKQMNSKEGSEKDIYEIKKTPIEELLKTFLDNQILMDEIETDESSYIFHLDNVAKLFSDFLDETFYSFENKDSDIIVNLVTTNLEKRFKELVDKNKVLVLMSGTVHSEDVLKNIFGLESFKIIEAETKTQGELIKCKHGYELDCRYSNFQTKKVSREDYLKVLSKSIKCAKPPTLVHVHSFSDLPTDFEKAKFNISNLPSQQELLQDQDNDPFGKKVTDFKLKKFEIFFTTKCNRGVDFPGDTCNSIVITRFPYPDISSIFWKILRKTKPNYFNSFYMDKAKREILQKIYRGLRSKTDKVYLLSPDVRVMDFEFEQNSVL